MKDSFNFFAGYLLLINFVTLLVYVIDKIKARLNYWQISEKVLFLLALFGGSFGALLAMYIFHHKTKKLDRSTYNFDYTNYINFKII